MEGSLYTALWFGWAFICAFGVRLGFTRLFRSWLGNAAQFAAYGMWFVLLLAGWIIVNLSGMQMYGFDASDPRQMWGYWVFFYSPLGLPTMFGAPAVLIVDMVRALITWRKLSQTV
jgi:hypothetical protein